LTICRVCFSSKWIGSLAEGGMEVVKIGEQQKGGLREIGMEDF
jgi:hypothetical protein